MWRRAKLWLTGALSRRRRRGRRRSWSDVWADWTTRRSTTSSWRSNSLGPISSKKWLWWTSSPDNRTRLIYAWICLLLRSSYLWDPPGNNSGRPRVYQKHLMPTSLDMWCSQKVFDIFSINVTMIVTRAKQEALALMSILDFQVFILFICLISRLSRLLLFSTLAACNVHFVTMFWKMLYKHSTVIRNLMMSTPVFFSLSGFIVS